MTECCTRCNRDVPIRQRDIIGGVPGWDVPYKLCGGCWDFYCSLDDGDATSQFAFDLWQKAAVRSLKPMGTA
jgi:hypothetical protein